MIKQLSDEYELTIQCVGYYPGSNHGAHFNRESLKVLGKLGIALDLDFYFVDDHGHTNEFGLSGMLICTPVEFLGGT